MARKISAKDRVSAVKDYMTSGETLRAVAARHGMSAETLRRFVGDKAKKRKNRVHNPSVLTLPFRKERASKDTTQPNSNRRWSSTDDALLRDAVLGNFTVQETVDLLGRTRASIMCRKHYLVGNGFIDRRFKVPTGITRTRRSSDLPVVVQTKPETEVKVLEKVQGEANLRELASLVRDFGVHIKMTLTPEGTTIIMNN